MVDSAPLILLVDDDVDFLEINRLILEPQGYRVRCCSNPDEAWRQMEQEKPNLIITDLMMNNLDAGFSFSQRVKDDPRFRDVPVIIATAVSSEQGFDFRPRTPAELAAMCVDAYFDKPIRPPALLAKVEELLRRRAEA